MIHVENTFPQFPAVSPLTKSMLACSDFRLPSWHLGIRMSIIDAPRCLLGGNNQRPKAESSSIIIKRPWSHYICAWISFSNILPHLYHLIRYMQSLPVFIGAEHRQTLSVVDRKTASETWLTWSRCNATCSVSRASRSRTITPH